MISVELNSKMSDYNSPGNDDYEVHHVPDVAQIRAFVQDETESNDFEQSLDAKYP